MKLSDFAILATTIIVLSFGGVAVRALGARWKRRRDKREAEEAEIARRLRG